MRAFLFYIFISFSCSLYACDCAPVSSFEKSVNLAFTNSDLVVLGTIKSVNEQEGNTIIQVLETYKGNSSDTLIIKTMSSCSLYFKPEETWLLYLNDLDEGLSSDQCLPNRIFSKMNLLSFPPPPSDSGKIEESYLRSILLYQELISLRQKKLLSTEKEPIINEGNENGIKWSIIIGLCINVLLLLLLLFKRR